MLITGRLVRYCDATRAAMEFCISITVHPAAKDLYSVFRRALGRARATVLGKVGRCVTEVGLSAILGGDEKVDDRPLATTKIGNVLIPTHLGHVMEGLFGREPNRNVTLRVDRCHQVA